MEAYRQRFSRMDPQGVLRSCRTAVKMVRDLRDAHRQRVDAKLRYESGPFASNEMDTICAAIDLLEGAGYFDIDGALAYAQGRITINRSQLISILRAGPRPIMADEVEHAIANARAVGIDVL